MVCSRSLWHPNWSVVLISSFLHVFISISPSLHLSISPSLKIFIAYSLLPFHILVGPQVTEESPDVVRQESSMSLEIGQGREHAHSFSSIASNRSSIDTEHDMDKEDPHNANDFVKSKDFFKFSMIRPPDGNKILCLE